MNDDFRLYKLLGLSRRCPFIELQTLASSLRDSGEADPQKLAAIDLLSDPFKRILYDDGKLEYSLEEPLTAASLARKRAFGPREPPLFEGFEKMKNDEFYKNEGGENTVRGLETVLKEKNGKKFKVTRKELEVDGALKFKEDRERQ